MNSDLYCKNIKFLSYQRNIFLALTVLLGCSAILLSTLLFWKQERIIVVPGVIEKEFWVDGHDVSATYLEQFGCFLGQLLLGKSSQSAPVQRTVLLRHTDPSFSGLLSKKLYEEEQLLSKQNSSYVFFPIDIQVDLPSKEVLLTGDRVFYVAGKAVSTDKESYILRFNYSGSRLLLKGVEAKEKK